jgi:hypothetical protein
MVAERCAYCDVLILRVKHRIHRGGLHGELNTVGDLHDIESRGPEVALCHACGDGETPTCEEIWQRIDEKRADTKGQGT